MKNSNIGRELILLVIALAPLAYLGFIWNQLPEIVPVHFDANGNPDREGSKMSLFWITLLLPLGTYGLMSVIKYFDPKQKIHLMGNKFWLLKLVMVVFISAICFVIIQSTVAGSTNMKLLYGLICLLFIFLGNYMQTVPPNYFVGMRTPWTLENEEVWKKTHRLTGKLMMGTGIVLFVLALVIPSNIYIFIFLIGVIVMTLIPVVFSYTEFKSVSS